MPSIASSVTVDNPDRATATAHKRPVSEPPVARPQPWTTGGRKRPRPARPQGARAAAIGRTTAMAKAPTRPMPPGLLYVPKMSRPGRG
jgi:hypothetical protein